MSKNRPNILVAWSDTALAQSISNVYEVVVSADELTRRLEKRPTPAGIVVLAEIKWQPGNTYLSDLRGLDLVRRLRVESRLLCPITICSFLPERWFFQAEHRSQTAANLYGLLKAPCHPFIRLPCDLRRLALAANPISEAELDDIIESLCSVDGLLTEEMHQLKNAVFCKTPLHRMGQAEAVKFRVEICKAVADTFARINRLIGDATAIARIRNDLMQELEQQVFEKRNFGAAAQIVDSFSARLENLLPIDGSRSVSRLPERTLWKALLIEDELDRRERIQAELDERNIECVAVGNADAAKRVLEADEGNFITVVIADYRLEDERRQRWQARQGYAILKDIHLRTDRMVSLFALTAAHRRALLRIEKEYQMRVLVYSKEDVLGSSGGFNIFAESVRKEGDKTFEAILCVPTGASWIKPTGKAERPLKEYYKAHRMALDYEEAEESISRVATDFVTRALDAEDREDDSLVPTPRSYQARLSTDPQDPKTMKRFRTKLIGRRIGIGLHAFLSLGSNVELYFALSAGRLNFLGISGDERSRAEQAAKQLLPTSLGLSLKNDYPNHLLVEEKNWLRKMGVFFDPESREVFQEFVNAINDFQGFLADHDCEHEFVEKQLLVFNSATAARILREAVKVANQYSVFPELKRFLVESLERITARAKTTRFREMGLEDVYASVQVLSNRNGES